MRETNILGFTVTCKYCSQVYTTTSTAELANYTRNHRAKHLGARPGTPAWWYEQKAKQAREEEINSWRKQLEQSRRDYEAFGHAKSLQQKALSDMVRAQRMLDIMTREKV